MSYYILSIKSIDNKTYELLITPTNKRNYDDIDYIQNQIDIQSDDAETINIGTIAYKKIDLIVPLNFDNITNYFSEHLHVKNAFCKTFDDIKTILFFENYSGDALLHLCMYVRNKTTDELLKISNDNVNIFQYYDGNNYAVLYNEGTLKNSSRHYSLTENLQNKNIKFNSKTKTYELITKPRAENTTDIIKNYIGYAIIALLPTYVGCVALYSCYKYLFVGK